MSRGTGTNIYNRSPWTVTVRGHPECDRRFAFPKKKEATEYRDQLHRCGLRPKLSQLENAYLLRLRRKGMREQAYTFSSKSEAEQARLHILSQLSVGIVRDFMVATRYTVADLMERYIEEVAPRHRGGDIEIVRLRRVIRDEAFVDKKVAAFDTEDLQDFVYSRLEEVAPATVARDLDVISQVLRYADEVWKIGAAESPLKGLRRPRYYNERDRRLRAGEEVRLLEAARQHGNPYVEAAIVFALETAMRRGEILSLRWEFIDYEARAARLPLTKNGRARSVPLSARATELLKALPVIDGPVFDLTANALKKAFFDRVVPLSGLEDFTFHDLRHEAISRFAESGQFQLIELQAISGHRDTRMLQRYAHLMPRQLAEKMDVCARVESGRYVWDGNKRRLKRATKAVLAGVD